MTPEPILHKSAGQTLRVAVVGGSIGGLTTALLLRDAGHDVDVFERSSTELTGFGAGIVAHEASLRYFVERTTTSPSEITVPVDTYRLVDGSGHLLFEERVAYRFISWGRLYQALLAAYGHTRYRRGATVVGFGQDERGVDVRFASGSADRYDLVVLADGILSTGRQHLFPGIEPVYAGYVAWRGTVAEREIPGSILSRLDGAITYALIAHSHILVYPIPGADGRIDRGHRRWNFVCYRNVEKGAPFDELMTDRDGFPHTISLRPGRVQERYVRDFKTFAAASFPPIAAVVAATEHPFIQAVMDVESPCMAVGRVCILGDAAFAARPHAAAGTAKAAENAWVLAEAIAAFEGDLTGALTVWSDHQTALGSRLVARARDIGDGSQFRCDWQAGDPRHRFGLYEPGDSSIWTRLPRPVTARV